MELVKMPPKDGSNGAEMPGLQEREDNSDTNDSNICNHENIYGDVETTQSIPNNAKFTV